MDTRKNVTPQQAISVLRKWHRNQLRIVQKRVKRSEESGNLDVSIGADNTALFWGRMKIEELDSIIKVLKRSHKNHSKMVIRDKSAGRNSLVAPIISGK